ncbi:MAG: protease modulator HflC, partial [Nevskia sp.]|nr:protease modulator HflC [Nevskia sp.]
DAEKLRGEGDAKTTELSAKAYGTDPEFYAFYRSLNAYRDAFKDQKDVLVLEPKGEFFKYFKQSEPGK